MGQYELRKNALSELKKIDSNRINYVIIHYTCEDFKIGQTISSIAVRQFNDGQTESFSIDKTAQVLRIDPTDIKENIENIEKRMLQDFYSYVNQHRSKNWIHWNMSSDNFGFKALEHRYKVLDGEPIIIEDSKKINLSHLFIELYDKGYAKHPRLENLMSMNFMNPLDMFPGFNKETDVTDEIDLLHQERYKEIQISCLRKVDVFANLLNLSIDNKLIVKTPKLKVYGNTIKGKAAALNERFWFKPLTYLLTLLVGYFFEKIMDLFFNFI